MKHFKENISSLIVVIATFSITRSISEITPEECRELGFIKSQLYCSSCDKLDDFGLDTLKPECKTCCTQDHVPAAQQRYPKAVLEVCTCKFRAYPQIQAFIKSGRPAKFPNLQIRYVRGLDPIVKLLDASGSVKETLSITKWNTDTVEEFFDTHLEKDGVAARNSYSVVEDEDEYEDDFLRTNRI